VSALTVAGMVPLIRILVSGLAVLLTVSEPISFC